MDKKPIFEVLKNDSGQRLDNFLFKQRKHLDRSQWYKLIRKGQVRVNGKRAKALQKLQSGDLVRIPPHVFFVETKTVQVSQFQVKNLWDRLIFEDTDYLVFDKPAGLACHAGTGHEVGLIELVNAKEHYEAVQLAHRLDKDTSGCILLAKNRQALLDFQHAMKNHQVKKTYLAVLDGRLEHKTVVNQPLDVDNRVNGMRTVVVSEQGKTAETTFSPLRKNGKYSLVACDIKSGRTHQIRVHAQFIGMPVLGDGLYGQANTQLKRKLFLHAESLIFSNYKWSAKTPEEFTVLTT